MPSLKILFAFTLAALFTPAWSPAHAENCGLSGTPAWNSTLRNVVAECSSSFGSPDGSLVLQISTQGTMSVSAKPEEKKLQWIAPKIVPPAMLSWSPTSKAFFLNDGDGSGMSSVFRFFRIKGTQVYEDKSIEREAVSFYRRRTHCASSAADPNVWGFGWDKHGGQLMLLVQATANESCGRPADFLGLVVRTADGQITQFLSRTKLQEQFGSELPPSLFKQ